MDYETPAGVGDVPIAALPVESSNASGLTGYDLAVLTLRLAAIYFVFEGLPSIIIIVISLFYGPPTEYQRTQELVTIALPGCYAGLAIFLWLASKPIARKIVTPSKRYQPPATLQAHQLQAVAFSVVGVLLMAWGFPLLIANMVTRRSGDPSVLESSWFIHEAVEILLGVVLFFQAKGLAIYWHRLRAHPTVTDQP
jgi:hypothetical protein